MMKTNESSENYLKTIYELQNFHGSVRSVDVSEMLGVSKASVCVAMKKLKKNNLIKMNDDKTLCLTADGKKCAKEITDKYDLLKRVLILLNVDEKTAARDACRIEHIISNESLNKIKMKVNKTLLTNN